MLEIQIMRVREEKQQQKLFWYCQVFYQALSTETKWKNKVDLFEHHFKLSLDLVEGRVELSQLLFRRMSSVLVILKHFQINL